MPAFLDSGKPLSSQRPRDLRVRAFFHHSPRITEGAGAPLRRNKPFGSSLLREADAWRRSGEQACAVRANKFMRRFLGMGRAFREARANCTTSVRQRAPRAGS